MERLWEEALEREMFARSEAQQRIGEEFQQLQERLELRFHAQVESQEQLRREAQAQEGGHVNPELEAKDKAAAHETQALAEKQESLAQRLAEAEEELKRQRPPFVPLPRKATVVSPLVVPPPQTPEPASLPRLMQPVPAQGCIPTES